MTSNFEPRIIAFACNWCSYAASDAAGTSRIHYPPNVRVIRVMCSGMVSRLYVLKALEEGADGVLVAGCRIGDCHYISGNMKCEKMIQNLKVSLHRLGLDDNRLRLQWISTGEGRLFAETIQEMVAQLKKIGPSPLKASKRTGKKRISAVQ
jgi:F420-non-reducing hydrogenase iron-sulfur subunit